MRELRVIEAGRVPYGIAYEWQCSLHARRVANEIPDVLLLLEHPHVYTLGRRFKKEHLVISRQFLEQRGIEFHESDRGGSITYHGPGQIVGYPILDLKKSDKPEEQPDPIKYLRVLEQILIQSLRAFGIFASRIDGKTGVWVGSRKIASIGVHISRGVTKHGFALNVSTDLSYFDGMIPCGLQDVSMTSMQAMLHTHIDAAVVANTLAKNAGRLLHRRITQAIVSEIGLDLDGGAKAGAKLPPLAPVIPIKKTSSG